MTDESNHQIQKEQEDDDVNGPVVFQCENCRTIIGDSFAFTSSEAELGLITLDGM